MMLSIVATLYHSAPHIEEFCARALKAADAANDCIRLDPHVLKAHLRHGTCTQAEFFQRSSNLHARCRSRHDERGDATVVTSPDVSRSVRNENVGDRRIGAERLRSVETKASALILCACFQRKRIRAGHGLRHCIGRDQQAAAQPGQKP